MNNAKFIKVSDDDTKQELIRLGFTMISEDEYIAVFVNDRQLTFDNKKMKVAYSDILTF
jgi:hypothetical protein